MAENFPLYSLEGEDLLLIFSDVNPGDNFHFNFIYFDQNAVYDRYDTLRNDLNLTSTIIQCDYFYFDELYSNCASDSSLKLLSYNIRSISENLNSFINDSISLKFDIMSYFETRLTDGIAPLYRITNYEMFCDNRSSAGGGAALDVSYRFDTFKVDQLSLN